MREHVMRSMENADRLHRQFGTDRFGDEVAERDKLSWEQRERFKIAQQVAVARRRNGPANHR